MTRKRSFLHSLWLGARYPALNRELYSNFGREHWLNEVDKDTQKRSFELLWNTMDQEQRNDLLNKKRFIVVSHENHPYLITLESMYGLKRLHFCNDRYTEFARLCVFPQMLFLVPLWDGVYQLKIMLEARGGEERIIRNANIAWEEPPVCHPQCFRAWKECYYHTIEVQNGPRGRLSRILRADLDEMYPDPWEFNADGTMDGRGNTRPSDWG